MDFNFVTIDPKNKLFAQGKRISELLQASGFEAFWVGGTVRDLILNRPQDNLDIATAAAPDEIEAVLKKAKIKTKDFGKKFGTILAVTDAGPVEITTFRAEGRYSDKRHPDSVKFISDYKQDSLRRDFTINAMYLDPKDGRVLDTQKGEKDLKGKLIRFVGDPKHRIDEDPLRMLRAVRFCVQLGFKMESNTFAAIKTRAKFISRISGERIKAELDKIMLSDKRADGIRLLDDCGILKFLIPDFPKLKTLEHDSKTYHLEGTVYDHILLGLQYPKNLLAYYAVLFHDVGKTRTKLRVYKNGQWVNSFPGHQRMSADLFEEFAGRVSFPARDKNVIKWLIIHHDDRRGFQESSLLKKIKYLTQPHFDLLLQVWRADSKSNLRLGQKGELVSRQSEACNIAEEILAKLKAKNGLIRQFANGAAIMSAGKIKPGPKVKDLINKTMEAIYLDRINSQADFKEFISAQH
jgi:tRNA nucleotidyltransferase/poly(A) polymerase